VSAEDEFDQRPCLVRELLRTYLREADRGVASDMAMNTTLTRAEISQFLSGHRPLPDNKILVALNWLMSESRLRIEVGRTSR
jgi:hypothetical protein